MEVSLSKSVGFSDSMRVQGRSAAAAGMNVQKNSTPAPADGETGRKGVYDKFKESLLNRIENSQRTGMASKTSSEDAQALVDSIAKTVSQVKETYGKETANAVMSNILKGINEKGVTLESVTGTVSDAVKYAAQAGSKHKRQEFMDELNQDLGVASASGEGAEKKTKGLSQAINDFFGLETRTDSKGTKAMGFDDNGNWKEVEAKADENGAKKQSFITGDAEIAEAALKTTSQFSIKDVGQDTVDDMADFLRNDLGNEEAARFLEDQSKHAGFMNAVDTVINKVLKNSDDRDGDASRLEKYLNGTVKTAINSSSKINSNQLGEVEFEGWKINPAAATEDGGQGEVKFSAKWHYTTRDDAVYESGSVVKARQAETAQTKKEADAESPMVKQMKKLAAQALGEDTGNLINNPSA